MATVNKGKVIQLNAHQERIYDASTEHEQNIVGLRIAQARRTNGLSLAAFSSLLKEYGVSVSGGAISKWELGSRVPNAYQLIAICNALGLEDELPYFMGAYHPALNEVGLQKVKEYRADLIASGKYRPDPIVRNVVKYISMPVSTLTVSAGTGAFLDEGNFEMIDFPESSVPDGAEFGVRVSGDSMEPVYHDGQIVWVQQCERVGIGEVGVFICDGEGYLKAYGEQEPDENLRDELTDSYGVLHAQPVMISYNQSYEPRVISPNSEFQVVGRIL